MDTENLQRSHYDAMASRYAAHYGDAWSQQYRTRFFNLPMVSGIELRGLRVLEAMCGSGETTGFLLENEARVVGLDISEKEIKAFRARWPSCEAHCASVLDTGLKPNSFDCVVVVGGLHHVHPHVPKAVGEIHRILRPGGYFCFVEPHKGSFPDRIRRYWYRRDRHFASNEESIDFDALREQFARDFDFVLETYKGGLAYQFVLNSMIWRIPLWLKPVYSRPFIFLESVLEPLHSRTLSCVVVAQWRKKVPSPPDRAMLHSDPTAQSFLALSGRETRTDPGSDR